MKAEPTPHQAAVFDAGPTDAEAGPWCLHSNTSYALDGLRPQALALLADAQQSMGTGAIAVALGVPFWVADVLLDDLQQAGACVQGPLGWRLGIDAAAGLALSLPPGLRAGKPGDGA